MKSSKWILALSNLVALYPIWCARYWSDALLLTMAMTVSLVHHCAEKRYYGPTLIKTSERTQCFKT